MNEVLLPELGEEIQKAKVACWHVNVGDYISEGDDIVELVTDKATFNVQASATGYVKEILANEREEVSIGAALAKIG